MYAALAGLAVVASSFLLLYLFFRPLTSGWRQALLSAAVSYGVIAVVIVEALSAVGLLALPGFLLSWTLVVAVAAIKIHKTRWDGIPKLRIPRDQIILLTAVGLLVAAVGAAAIFAPPNTWDSMTYHMSRVAHWTQNQNINHYPTAILRQIYSTPAAEFLLLNVYILCGGDSFVNLIQWASMIGCIIGITLIAKQLGIPQRGQVFTAVFCATIPMGLLEGSSTQTDYVTSFWVVCAAYYILRLKNFSKPSFADISAAAASVGMAFLTKPTAYLAVPPFILLYLIFSRHTRLERVRNVCLILLIAVLISSGHIARNFVLFGTSFSPYSISINGKYGVNVFASNLLRTAALHLGATPFPAVNGLVNQTVYALHDAINTDVNDRQTTYGSTRFAVSYVFHEDLSGNPFHLLLALCAIAYLTLRHRRRELLTYLAAVVLGFLLFCFFLKWSPWNSRLHLSFFVLFSPVVGFVLADFRSRNVGFAVCLALVVFAVPYVLWNASRPLYGERTVFNVPREAQYFANQMVIAVPYRGAADFIASRGCSDVGLLVREDDYEYPLWVLLSERIKGGLRIEHVALAKDNPSVKLQKDFTPCAVFSVRFKDPVLFVQSVKYVPGWSSQPVAVYVKA
ncbi:Dolichyl-phosphate-mannose-protein mannosyltransferase [uncultured archaeon]|nr:Dolichyl-phosphate-mannose-protein mannosyltransferase [uncultured archaeon]